MNQFFSKYKAFIIAPIFTLLLGAFLRHIGFIKIGSTETVELAVIFIFWSAIFSLPIYKFQYLKKNRSTVLKLVGLIALFVLVIIIDNWLGIPDNPFTIIMLVGFWIGLVYLLAPSFFKKYKRGIIGSYSILLLYFTILRLTAVDFENYVANYKEQAIISLLIPIPIFFLLWVYEQWRWVKSLQVEKTNAEIALLRTQINPHFFFNTLNNLYSLTVQQSEKAPEVILKLSEMMRYTIYEGEKQEVKLEDEIAYLNNYIDLHRIRYKKKVDFQFDTNITSDAKIAPLLLIMLLENALKHGVESMADNAFVKMKLTANQDEIMFFIENNFEPSEEHQTGIGLQNLRKRLELLYPKQYSLLIIEKDSIFSAELKIDTK